MGLINEKIPAIIGEVKAVGKDHTNEAQKYKFRAIDDVYNALNSVLAKHKVCIIPKYQIIHNEVISELKKSSYGEKMQNTRTVILQGNYKITAEDGSFEEVTTFGEAIDFGDKAFNKAMSQALKYCLFQVFCIPTEEEKDAECKSPEIPKKEEIKKPAQEVKKEEAVKVSAENVTYIYTLITKTGFDKEKLYEAYKVQSMKDLTAAQATKVVEGLRKIEKEQEDKK